MLLPASDRRAVDSQPKRVYGVHTGTFVPTEPLRELLEYRALSFRAIAEDCAERSARRGGRDTWCRWIERIWCRDQHYTSLYRADVLLTVLGHHISRVYPEVIAMPEVDELTEEEFAEAAAVLDARDFDAAGEGGPTAVQAFLDLWRAIPDDVVAVDHGLEADNEREEVG